MFLKATGVEHAYIKQNLSLTNPLPATRKVAFGITEGENLLTPGTSFTVTGGVFNDNILGTYTVDKIINGMVITTTSSSGKTTSGTDNPTTNISGVTLVGSYDYPSADYMERFNKPLAEWVEITLGEENITDLKTYLSKCIDYDKISILLIGNSISISDISFITSGTTIKNIETLKKYIPQYLKGTSLINDSLLDDNSNWDNINNIEKYIPVTKPGTTTTEPLPYGISTVRILNEGESITQSYNATLLDTDPYHLDHIQIHVMARYFPKYVGSDEDWNDTEIYEGSYDCATMSIIINGKNYCAKTPVGAFWGEYIFDVYYQPGNFTKKLEIKCENKSLQLAKIEMVLI